MGYGNTQGVIEPQRQQSNSKKPRNSSDWFRLRF